MARLYIIIFLLLFFGSGSSVSAQKVPEHKIAFKSGEKLVYAVSYKVSFVNTDIATVTFNTRNSSVNGIPTYRITAVGEVDQFYKWFFDMRDVYDTWLDKETLRPVYFKNNIKEGNYRFVSSMHYDWDKMVVNTQWKNLRINIDYQKQMKLTPQSFDAIALYYNLRNTDLQLIKSGFKDHIELVLSDTIKRLEYKFLGREVKTIDGLGQFKTLKFSCQLTTSADNSFKDGSEFFVWFSDDQNKIPLYLESPIRVGSVKARLIDYSGLKFPLSSKIK